MTLIAITTCYLYSLNIFPDFSIPIIVVVSCKSILFLYLHQVFFYSRPNNNTYQRKHKKKQEVVKTYTGAFRTLIICFRETIMANSFVTFVLNIKLVLPWVLLVWNFLFYCVCIAIFPAQKKHSIRIIKIFTTAINLNFHQNCSSRNKLFIVKFCFPLITISWISIWFFFFSFCESLFKAWNTATEQFFLKQKSQLKKTRDFVFNFWNNHIVFQLFWFFISIFFVFC